MFLKLSFMSMLTTELRFFSNFDLSVFCCYFLFLVYGSGGGGNLRCTLQLPGAY